MKYFEKTDSKYLEYRKISTRSVKKFHHFVKHTRMCVSPKLLNHLCNTYDTKYTDSKSQTGR